MGKIISKTIKIISKELPPKTDFIIEQIRNKGMEPVRWAIVEIETNELTLNVSGYEINKYHM